LPHPPAAALFHYTTLFRSIEWSTADSTPGGNFWWVTAVFRVRVTSARALQRYSWCCSIPMAQSSASRLPFVPERRVCPTTPTPRSEEHTSELQSRENLVCR